jgi:hypothetical protein
MANINLESKECSRCRKLKKSDGNFYLSSNDLINKDHRISICKLCLEEIVEFPDTESFIDILRQIDRPFLRSEYDASLAHKKPFGEYMRRLAMAQNRHKNYIQSEFEQTFLEKQPKSAKDLNKKVKVEDVVKFNITPDMLIRWGSGYSENDLFQLESFYRAMHDANDITTPQHIESLKLICKLNIEQNKALNDGRVNDFKNLNMQYNKVSETSGLRPIDKKSGGESAGLRTFSQIWEEVERDGFIEPYAYEEKQDIIDKTIMYMGNYTRKLMNMQSMSEPPQDTPKVDRDDEE